MTKLTIKLLGSHGGELDREDVRIPHEKWSGEQDPKIKAALFALINRCTLADGDQITIDMEA